MARRILRKDWIAIMERLVFSSQKVDHTGTFLQAIQWLIINLMKANRPFKLYNLGAGVKRITTETDTCPCCKRKLS